MKNFIIVFIIACFILQSAAKTKQEWKNRHIYQIITDRFDRGDGTTPDCDLKANTYCGGTFKGISNRLDYIKNLGFDAIWISPIVKNAGNNFHGYAAIDLYEINPHFGTAFEFKQFVQACHAKDIWVMVDVAPNHMSCLLDGVTYETYVPFNKEEYFHPECAIEFPEGGPVDIKNFQECRLACLTDLNQDHPFVREKLKEWIKDLVQKYDIDGLRIDTVPEVPKSFWKEFTESAGVFQIGEVFDSRLFFVAGYQGVLTSVFNYPHYQLSTNVFKHGGNIKDFEGYFKMMYDFEDRFAVGSFADNHDNERFLYGFNNEKRFKAFLTFQLTSIGVSVLYYGSEQGFNGGGDPYNREAMWSTAGYKFDETNQYYKWIQKLMFAKKEMLWNNYEQIQSYADDEFYAFTRDKSLFLFTTNESSVRRTIAWPKVYSVGDKICNIFITNDCVTITASGADVHLWNGETKIYVPEADLNNLKNKYPTIYNTLAAVKQFLAKD